MCPPNEPTEDPGGGYFIIIIIFTVWGSLPFSIKLKSELLFLWKICESRADDQTLLSLDCSQEI